MKAHCREYMNLLLPIIQGHYNTESPFHQIQGSPGSLSSVCLGYIYFCSSLNWHCLSRRVFICFICFGLPCYFRSPSNVCVMHSCGNRVGDQFWFTFLPIVQIWGNSQFQEGNILSMASFLQQPTEATDQSPSLPDRQVNLLRT